MIINRNDQNDLKRGSCYSRNRKKRRDSNYHNESNFIVDDQNDCATFDDIYNGGKASTTPGIVK